MFLQKWTIQITRPGQLEELGFDSREEALQYVKEQMSQGDRLTAATLIDPAGSQTVLALSDGEGQPEERRTAAA